MANGEIAFGFTVWHVLFFPRKSVNSELRARGWDPDVDSFPGWRECWDWVGDYAASLRFPHRCGCVDGVGAGFLALRCIQVAVSISSRFRGWRTPVAKTIHTVQPSADWPGYTEGSAGDGRRWGAPLQHTSSCLLVWDVLSWWWSGRVVHGDWIGRSLGKLMWCELISVKLTPLSSAQALVSPVSKMLELSGGQKGF